MSTVNTPCDNTPDWYWPAWASEVSWPRFHVRDTASSHGRYADGTKCITFKDLVKFHGHPCDGLFRGGVALSRAFALLTGDSPVDRTDLRVMSRNSPCLGDVAAYLTGGRTRFGTQDVRDEAGVWYIVGRLSDGATVRVVERSGFYPHDLQALEATLVATRQAEPDTLDRLQAAQWAWVRDVLSTADWDAAYPAERLPDFHWEQVPYGHLGIRTDVLFKNVPRVVPPNP
jgi:formylmethanofuran dehydrogenase subunit E